MLSSLYLRDFAIADRIELEFGAGLSAISGETGAGKSLLVDALMLLTGTRADPTAVRHGAERAELGAEFDLADAPAARAWLAEQELEGDDDRCQLRRVIRADGGSRAWINGRPATLAQLAELGQHLVEIHGQHEHQALLRRPEQLELLDAFGAHQAERAEVARRHAEWQAVRQRLEALERDGDPAHRIEELERELARFRGEALAPEEIDALQVGHRRQANVANLIEGCGRVLGLLASEDGTSAGSAVAQSRHELERLSADAPELVPAHAALAAAQIQLDEALALVERVRDGFDLDPARLEELDARLGRLHDLARRHRVRLEDLADCRDRLANDLDQLRNADAVRAQLSQQQAAALHAWREAAGRLTSVREQAARRLVEGVGALLGELGMAGGRFEVAFETRPDPQPDSLGAERVELLVSANPGQPPRPLRKVASGGELSRISLAIEVAALGADAVPTMVFDEVDSGIGGAVAEVVGRKLRALAAQRQVLCVTHLAQVAAHGHAHYAVSKQVSRGSTRTRVEALDAKARGEELARMLGGVQLTAETRAHARQMLARAQAD